MGFYIWFAKHMKKNKKVYECAATTIPDSLMLNMLLSGLGMLKRLHLCPSEDFQPFKPTLDRFFKGAQIHIGHHIFDLGELKQRAMLKDQQS